MRTKEAPLKSAGRGLMDSSSNALVQFIPFLIILAIFYFLIFMPMRRRQKKVREFQTALKVGDRVITTGGLYGQITKVNEQTVKLQIAEKVHVEIAKAGIGGYQGQEPVVPDGANT